jgi:hypothetical protein
LKLKLTRPDAAAGPSIRIDEVELTVQHGERAVDSALSMTINATQGGRHTIALPKQSELIAVRINSETQTLRLRDSQLELPLVPGRNRFEINFRELRQQGFATYLPSIDLRLPAANIRMQTSVSAQRWLLWTSGPALGPAVLFWPSLIVILILAALLARSGKTALGFGSWALLGLGLCGSGWLGFIAVAAWFLVLQWRASWVHGGEFDNISRYNAAQLGIILLSAVAIVWLIAAVGVGLLARIDMGVAGNGSSNFSLNWFADRSQSLLPNAVYYSVPNWVYKLAMLAWAFWIALSLLKWLKYAWKAVNAGGPLFKWKPAAELTMPNADPNSLPPPLKAKFSEQGELTQHDQKQAALRALGLSQLGEDQRLLHAATQHADVLALLDLRASPRTGSLLPASRLLQIQAIRGTFDQSVLELLLRQAAHLARSAGNEELLIAKPLLSDEHADALHLQTAGEDRLFDLNR